MSIQENPSYEYIERDLMLERIARLEASVVELEKKAFPLLVSNGNGHIVAPLHSISENIKPPAKIGDVGYNLVSNEQSVIPLGDVRNIRTGVKVKIPDGYWGLITARSSAVFKHHILVLPGVIDNGYTGELMVACTALVQQRILEAGTSIAQLILFPMVTPVIEIVQELPKTDRGETGFGSTGA